MKILNECNLALIVSELLNEKVFIFPTETSYGLGSVATSESAVEKIYAIKGRDKTKSLLAVVSNVEMAKEYLEWNPLMEKIAEKYWPGALTMVGKYNGKNPLAKGVVSAEGTVAIRVTDFPLLRSITEKLGKPLIATSANISGAGDIYDSENAISQFEGREIRPDYIINYGVLPSKQPSTLVKIMGEGFEILRQGEIIVEL